jgi:hypothetical protein
MSNIFDEVQHQLWVEYLPFYLASIAVIYAVLVSFTRKLVNEGVIYFREFVLIVSSAILGVIPIVNSAIACLIVGKYVVDSIVKLFQFLDSHEKDVIFKFKK